MTSPAPLVDVVGLSKVYGRSEAASDVSFSVGAGECVGLLGPNGAGKTSVLNCLVGLRRPTTGSVRVCGENPAAMGRGGRRLGFVFDSQALSPDFTASDCLAWEARAQGLPRSVVGDTVLRFEMTGYAKRLVRKLSTGQRQRLALAAALIGNPDILILDEPNNGLDVEAGRWLRDLLDERTQRGQTTIVSSHLLDEIRRVTTRVLVLNQTLRHDGPVPNLQNELLEAWYLEAIGRAVEVTA